MSNINVSVVVNHYKSPKVLKLALNYVSAWKKDFEKSGGIAEVIVTDSETIGETTEMMNQLFPSFIFLKEPKNIGFGRSVNRAWEIAQGEYIFTMNADFVIPRPQELNKLLHYLQDNSNIGIIGPRLLNFDGTHQPSAFRYYTPKTIFYRRTFFKKLPQAKKHTDVFTLKHYDKLTKEPTEIDWLMGSAMLIKREHLDKVGFFDERYFMYMEDVDLCRRFWEAGYKVIYYPDSVMHHFHGQASRSKNIFKSLFNKYTRIHLQSAYKYFRKHGTKKVQYGV